MKIRNINPYIAGFVLMLAVNQGNGNSGDVVLSENLSEADRLVISGGVVGRAPVKTPLVQAFEDYHFETILDLLAHVRDGFDAYTGDERRLLLSGNPAGGFHYGRWIEEARYFDYLNVELNVAELNRSLNHFLAVSALAEAVGSTLMVMPDARSNTLWRAEEDPAAYARGTGLTYALGGYMHVPWCLYDGSVNTRFYGSLEGHQPIFRMIRENAPFLDGYVPALWHVVEVPYGPAGVENIRLLENRLGELLERGISWVIRLRNPDLLNRDLSPERRAELEDEDGERFGEDRWAGNPRSKEILGGGGTANSPDSPFATDESFQSRFLAPIARVSAAPSDAPVVVHLIRRDDGKDSRGARRQFTIRKALWGEGEVRDVEIASVRWDGDPEAGVEWEMSPEGDLLVTVDRISAWAMLRVRTDRPVRPSGIERLPLREEMEESEVPLMRMIRFDDHWKRPQWVDDLLALEEDPLDGYGITRISWSYDSSPNTIEHAKSKGWAFHGSTALMHTWMLDSEVPKEEDVGILKFPSDWEGWARYPNGEPMLIRAEWNPPRYGSSFASVAYRQAVLEQCLDWVRMGADGVQLDDVSGMLNRVWQYGGDFSENLFRGFRAYLGERGFEGVVEETTLDDLRKRVVREMEWENAARVVSAGPPESEPEIGWIAAPLKATSQGYPGEVWISSPLLTRNGPVHRVEWGFRIPDDGSPHLDFQLMNGDRTEWFAAVSVREGLVHRQMADRESEATGISVPANQWTALRMEVDFSASTFRYAVGDHAWSESYPFAIRWPEKQSRFRFNVMTNPLRSSFQLRSLTIDQ